MKIYENETKVVPVHVADECDWCGRKRRAHGEWVDEVHDSEETVAGGCVVESRNGQRGVHEGMGWSIETRSAMLCHECSEKVLNWIGVQGATIHSQVSEE